MYLLDSLVDKNGHILIDGIYNNLAQIEENERAFYENISFDVDEFRKDIGCNKLPHDEDKTKLLMHRWRYPSLSIHGIEGAFHERGQKTVIPRKVTGKFSIRIVPNQTIAEIDRLVLAHLNAKWNERESSNTITCQMNSGGEPWMENPNHPHYEAAKRATQYAYQVEPDLTRGEGSLPIVEVLKEATNSNVLLLPIGASDDGAHSQNEKLDVRNFIEGVREYLFASIYYIIKICAEITNSFRDFLDEITWSLSI